MTNALEIINGYLECLCLNLGGGIKEHNWSAH